MAEHQPEYSILIVSDAQKQYEAFQKVDQKKLGKALERMQTKPFYRASRLKHVNQAVWRSKSGDRLRIIFLADIKAKVIKILAFDLRDDDTYDQSNLDKILRR